ncbi:hypothetical protein Ait01nite_026240 [Actinoplanes italicus]|uniref:Uncharacterized protein n=1 Tax=Actinoplanes italicus TaxID=113567 RepID=A0A2T0KF62_9ACTN|nr:hypothetical protein [Actinoplanes italicus]PRX22002.1 hypothetical protein CLV67_105179 [Actinoplanes italicus]GIE29579.1 hypothetical protein Ait01nite_026240 [Actinoplanes italicus]
MDSFSNVEKSEAIILYTGRGRSPVPQGDLEAVRAQSEGLAEYVKKVREDFWTNFPLDWGRRNNIPESQVTTALESAVAARYPELSSTAVRALISNWSYSSWK